MTAEHKSEVKSEVLYSMGLGDAYKVSREKRTGRAVSLIKTFVARHSKSAISSVRLSTALNNFIWTYGAANPIRHLKFKVSKEGEKVVVRLPDEKSDEVKKVEAKKEEKPAAKEAEKKSEPKTEVKKEEKKTDKKEEKVAEPKAKSAQKPEPSAPKIINEKEAK
ncbi:TPA: 50S ribosomal protein L31e [Candidatus Micrarchaeota archaeon]|nr:50S ribosomal protein L31e [Candidatus Micrarchaeota archaeon]